MKTKNTFVIGEILGLAAALGLSSAAFAQSDSQKSATPSKQHKQAPKKEKVWTNDDFGSVPAPAAAKANQTASSDASEQPAPANQTAGSNQRMGGGAPVFTNPKSVAEADRMIAWENRDIDAQQEFLAKVRREIDEAPADQKDRLTKLLQQRMQILADTQNELKNVEMKKKDLEKPPADNNSASAEQPPQ
jgi:hypothetical protein